MWTLGWQETLVIFLLALLLFGPKKLPELGKNIAKGLAEFRRASSELKSTFDREMANIERETNPIKETAQEISNSTYDYSYYENSYYENSYSDSSGEGSTTTSQDTTVSASATQGAESTTAAASGDAADGLQAASASVSDSGATQATVQTASSEAPSAQPVTVDKPVARS
jgi:TatA/E family protein of Tat protein translocase